jgi:anthranilate/para-aminobenzoate synthase component I
METACVHPLDLALTPSEAALQLHERDGFVFLDSAGHTETEQPLSILAADPLEVHVGNLHSDAAYLKRILARNQRTTVDWGFPLGGLFGYVSYEGDFVFGEYDSLLIYHHHQGGWFTVGQPAYLEELTTSPTRVEADPNTIAFTSRTPRDAFIRAVQEAQASIAAGDIYQVNLAHQFQAERTPSHRPFSIYERLRTRSPAPYSAYVNLQDRHVLSSSPECFLKISGRGIATRPIKGTRPRFSDPVQDEQSAYDLMTSPKEVSELVMITDLERNDLGRICTYGSVNVTELLRLERYAQVFHLVSTVRGELREDIDHIDALRLCSPGGSITGAPKKSAREIISALEPVPRGIYTGAIGYLGWNGESQFSIAIRTLIGEPDHWHFHVGAGIVADSGPGMEYEETLHKAAGILMTCQSPRSATALTAR